MAPAPGSAPSLGRFGVVNASFAQEYLTQKRLMRREKQKVAGLRNCNLIRRGLRKLICSLRIGLGTLRAPGLERELNAESGAVTAFRSLPDMGLNSASSSEHLENAPSAGARKRAQCGIGCRDGSSKSSRHRLGSASSSECLGNGSAAGRRPNEHFSRALTACP